MNKSVFVDLAGVVAFASLLIAGHELPNDLFLDIAYVYGWVYSAFMILSGLSLTAFTSDDPDVTSYDLGRWIDHFRDPKIRTLDNVLDILAVTVIASYGHVYLALAWAWGMFLLKGQVSMWLTIEKRWERRNAKRNP